MVGAGRAEVRASNPWQQAELLKPYQNLVSDRFPPQGQHTNRNRVNRWLHLMGVLFLLRRKRFITIRREPLDWHCQLP